MWNIGQKVVCIDDKRQYHELGALQEDCIYTITGFNHYDGGLVLAETTASGPYGAYLKERFIPLTEYTENQEAVEELFKELDLQVN